MPSPLLQLRIPQDLADWLEAKFQGRGEVAEYVRQLLTAEQMKEATAPLVPADEVRGIWKGTAAQWTAFQEGAGFETLEPTPEEIRRQMQIDGLKPKARRKDVRKVPDQPVSVKNRGGVLAATQELSSKSVKGSPDERSVGSEVEAKNESARVNPESPSPKPRKPKGCPHANTIRKLGMPFCEDCGEFV